MAENDSWNNGSAQNRGFSNAGNGANGMNGRSGQAVRDALFDRVPPHDDAAEIHQCAGIDDACPQRFGKHVVRKRKVEIAQAE